MVHEGDGELWPQKYLCMKQKAVIIQQTEQASIKWMTQPANFNNANKRLLFPPLLYGLSVGGAAIRHYKLVLTLYSTVSMKP